MAGATEVVRPRPKDAGVRVTPVTPSVGAAEPVIGEDLSAEAPATVGPSRPRGALAGPCVRMGCIGVAVRVEKPAVGVLTPSSA